MLQYLMIGLLALTVPAVSGLRGQTAYGQEKQENVIICPECKAENAAGSKFCRQCGALLPQPLPTTPEPVRGIDQKSTPAGDAGLPVVTVDQESAPVGDASLEARLETLSREELVKLVELLSARIGAQSQTVGEPNLVGNMTRDELRVLIREMLLQYSRPAKRSGFRKFLEVFGGISLAVLGVMMITL